MEFDLLGFLPRFRLILWNVRNYSALKRLDILPILTKWNGRWSNVRRLITHFAIQSPADKHVSEHMGEDMRECLVR